MRGPDKHKTERARGLRRVENDAEEALWFELRARRLNGFKFLRQLPIGPYFADFACRQAGLVVEVDGSQHANSGHDAKRDAYMVTNGWSVVRFWNGCVLQDRERVLETIVEIVENRLVQEVRSFDLTFVPAQRLIDDAQ
ncbi:endonuclease domain-containing protein [Pararhizobium sp. PWRC1-1]|uniref:endonuclease domain-containing protein n=1 Tax=Pararhizobium sp. PWRC1-1 TaxID=2804566 RepID=UPI003CF92E21